jgi:hypothetical protein
MMSQRKARSLRVSRDTILFIVGLLGIAYETLIDAVDKPTLLIGFFAMVGLPVFLRTDEKAKAKTEAVETTAAADKPAQPANPPDAAP